MRRRLIAASVLVMIRVQVGIIGALSSHSLSDGDRHVPVQQVWSAVPGLPRGEPPAPAQTRHHPQRQNASAWSS